MPAPLTTPVALVRQAGYAPEGLAASVDALFTACGFSPPRGARVLVKPNLVAATRGPLACSEPAVVAAACAWLLDHGARPWVADSPAFGTARGVGRAIGLAAALAPLGVPLRGLGRPRRLALDFGGGIGVSRDAQEADLILSLPRLKAHGQMRLTAGVKNLFGCVVGARKPLAHSRHGEKDNRFESVLVQVMAALPPAFTLLDAVVAMSRTGPTGGDPLNLGLLAASPSPVALDTALFTALRQRPQDIATWAECLRRGLPGARPEDITFPLLRPEDFDFTGFTVPGRLDPVSFHPLRLAKGAWKRLKARFS
ncbi:MAG: DUF362 domain-containing protein [Thermodesulfobacteriota bacterium]